MMALRVRVVPLAILASIGLLGIKIGDLSSVMLATPTARAEGQAPQAPAAPSPQAAAAATPPATPVDAHPRPSGAPTPAVAGDKASGVDPLSMSPSEIDLLQKLAERRAALDKRSAELDQREILLQAAEKRVDEKIAKLAALEKDIDGIVE